MATATKTVDFDIEYPDLCPGCVAEGNKDVHLAFSTSEGILCTSGAHRYAAMPGADGNPQVPQADAPKAVQELEDTVKLKGFDSRVFSGDGRVDKGPSPDERRQRLSEQIQDKMREQARKGPALVPAAPVVAPRPDVAKVVAAESVDPGKRVQVLDKPLLMAAGELKLTVILRERHATAVQAEAGVQGQSVEVYFQEFMERFLDSYWGQV